MDSPAANLPAEDSPAATPMMAQYLEIKAANPDCLLFYRMGDFYEMFFDDAEVASRALGITLTRRGKHQGDDIPMCGVPIHAADQYLEKLIALGHRVAVCEQAEDPAEAKKRGYKSVVRREVIRLVTPGTLTEDTLLAPGRNNFLAAIARQRGGSGGDVFAIAWIDISTGEFRVSPSERTPACRRSRPRRSARGAGRRRRFRRCRSRALLARPRRRRHAAVGGLLRRRHRRRAADGQFRRQEPRRVRRLQPRRTVGRRGGAGLCREDPDRRAAAACRRRFARRPAT